jgi:hypothetical protein
MKKITLLLTPFLLCCAFQSYDLAMAGNYTNGTTASLELKTDNTFKETHGGEWRNGFWKMRHDTILVDERMTHSSQRGVAYAYQQFFLVKKEGILIGKDLLKKAKAPAKK